MSKGTIEHRAHLEFLRSQLANFAMPAESAPHERTLIAFPCRTDLWRGRLREGQEAWSHVARSIADFEPVTMLANQHDITLASELASHPNIEIVEMPLDDSWLRDTAPIFVTKNSNSQPLQTGRDRVALDFVFNGWGEKYVPFKSDDQVPARWCSLRSEARIAIDMVLEGGSITVDGDGTLITTEQCLLNPNRNPHLSRTQIEEILHVALGVSKVIWLPLSIDDRDTDGHVDLVAMFIEPGRVLWQGCDDPNDPEFQRLALSRRCLDGSYDARNRGIQIVDVPVLPYCEVDGERFPVPYCNLYLCNGAVIVPVTGHPADEDMLAIIGSAWPDRRVVGVPGDIVAFGGGGPHCTTQQIPLA
jgi:agmatine deiminase